MNHCALLCLIGVALALPVWGGAHTPLKIDEQLVFYPALAWRSENATWQIEIRGCVHEPERRGLSLAAVRLALGLSDVVMTPEEERLFNARARLFLVDHERGKEVCVRFGRQTFRVGESQANGTFSGTITLSHRELLRLTDGAPASGAARTQHEEPRRAGGMDFEAVLPPGDSRRFTGQVHLLEATGLSVISDIDDTIKITEVRDRRAMLRNTFLRDFQGVPGMAGFYQTLARFNGARFHYVSASPWQLYPLVAEFIQSSGFPEGTFALRAFRWKDESFFNLFTDPEAYKLAAIEPLLRQFPQRRFVLVGDSGERDPEVYAALARKFPEQIRRIYIRDVTGEPGTAARYQQCFSGIPGNRWQVFRAPGEIQIASP